MNANNGSGPDAFEEVLAEVVYEGVLEGIDVEGGWDISAENRNDLPDFTVEIYRVK